MTNEQKIDYMIQSLELAKEEITYAKTYSENKNLEQERIPNGTVIRESLKMVGRMANMVANEVQLSPYCREVFRGDKHK
jgi:hypothetical protein